ncbi:MAG: DUF4339 domain-containing protein [Verrucomicrobiota bacterium JB024]|nr:DUF4339 domain-containing protein [Verrucomicrobiota bacterium JB024]
MPWDKDAVYYYADGDNAIGPFTLAKLKQMVAAGLISGDVYVGIAESDDWKPLCEPSMYPGKLALGLRRSSGELRLRDLPRRYPFGQ